MPQTGCACLSGCRVLGDGVGGWMERGRKVVWHLGCIGWFCVQLLQSAEPDLTSAS